MLCICAECGNEYTYNKTDRSGKTDTMCRTCYNHRSRVRAKLRAIAYLGGKCSLCGYSKCSAALEFHHIDPSKKSFNISTQLKAWDKLQDELDKCILVCANCHREIEHQHLMI